MRVKYEKNLYFIILNNETPQIRCVKNRTGKLQASSRVSKKPRISTIVCLDTQIFFAPKFSKMKLNLEKLCSETKLEIPIKVLR